MKCPWCGGKNISCVPITKSNTTTKTKGFGGCNACCGFLLFGWIGILCGLCGMGKGKTSTTHKTKIVKVCNDCGRKF